MGRRGYPKDHPYYTPNAYQLPIKHHYRDSGCVALGHAIAKARVAADMKQGELADKLGVARSRVAQWEGAKRPVPWKFMEPLTDLFETHDTWDVEPYSIEKKIPLFARMVR